MTSAKPNPTGEDAQLILRLHELRSAKEMQKAWEWFVTGFFPESTGDIKAVLRSAHPHNADFRIITSYWDMAASFAVQGALNEQLFVEWAAEMMVMWVRIADYIEGVRREFPAPGFLANVEKMAGIAAVEVERAEILDQASRKNYMRREAVDYLRSGWACSEYDQEAILRDYEAICLNSQLGIASICNLELAARHVVGKKLQGSFVECGTWRGGGIGYWARSFMRNGGNDSETDLYGFDSFQGMPRMTRADGERASQWLYGKRLDEIERPLTDGSLVATGTNVASENECRALIETSGYNKESIHIIKGWFQDTLPKHKRQIGSIAVLRLDADFYEATRFCLETLYDSVVSHGVVIVDDYEYFEGCRKAVDEFIACRDAIIDLIYYGDFGRFFFKP